MAGYPPLREPIIDIKTGRLTPVWERYFTLTLQPALNQSIEGSGEIDFSSIILGDAPDDNINTLEKFLYSLIHPPDVGILKRVENLEKALQFVDGPKDVSFLQNLDALEALIFGGPIIILPQDLLKTSGPIFDHIHLTSGQVGFPSTAVPSADANTLDDYTEYTAASTACTGAITTALAYTLVKVGRQVTMYVPATTGAGVAVAGITFGVALPAKYRPAANLSIFAPRMIDNGANKAGPGYVQILAAGTIIVYLDGTTPNFTVTANAGFNAFCVSWVSAA